MPVSFRQLHPAFAAEVSGIGCGKALDADEIAAVEAGMDRYAVLVFPDQKITDEQQLAFTRNFGELENYASRRSYQEANATAGLVRASRISPIWTRTAGSCRPRTGCGSSSSATGLWHSDSSFRPVPAKYSLLSGRVLPSWGANTEFADMRAAYDALDARTKAEVEDLVCLHSLIYSRQAIGFTELTEEEIASFPRCANAWCARIR